MGHWLSDVTPLLPLLSRSTGTCSFTLQSAPWAGAWRPTLNLRFTAAAAPEQAPAPAPPPSTLIHVEMEGGSLRDDAGGPRAAVRSAMASVEEGGEEEGEKKKEEGVPRSDEEDGDGSTLTAAAGGHGDGGWGAGVAAVPWQVVPLFDGATFDSSYNERQPMQFETPVGASKAVIHAVITGRSPPWSIPETAFLVFLVLDQASRNADGIGARSSGDACDACDAVFGGGCC